MAAEHDIAAGAAHALDRIDAGEKVLERLGALGPHLEDQAGVAGHGVDLLDLGQIGQRQHGLALAPALGIDMDESQERATGFGAVEPRHGAHDHAVAAQPFDPLVNCCRGKMQAIAELGIAQARILGENAQQCSVEPIQGDARPGSRPNRIRIFRHDAAFPLRSNVIRPFL